MEALTEYPDAKTILEEKGRAILKKDNLIDESLLLLPDAKELESTVLRCEVGLELMSTKFRKLAERHETYERKLKQRLGNMESRVRTLRE